MDFAFGGANQCRNPDMAGGPAPTKSHGAPVEAENETIGDGGHSKVLNTLCMCMSTVLALRRSICTGLGQARVQTSALSIIARRPKLPQAFLKSLEEYLLRIFCRV